MALDFPNNPTNGQVFSGPTKSWTYSSAISAWESSSNTVVNPTRTILTGNGVLSAFSIGGADNLTNPSALTVSIDGATQIPVTDYSVTNGVITFTSPVPNGSVALVISPTNSLQVANVVPADGSVTSAKLDTNLSIIGGLSAGGRITANGQGALSALGNNDVLTKSLGNAAYGDYSVLTIPTLVSLKDYFVGGTPANGSIGDLGWTAWGTGVQTGNMGNGRGWSLMSANGITSSLNSTGMTLGATGYTGGGVGYRKSTLPFQMVARTLHGTSNNLRKFSWSFGFDGDETNGNLNITTAKNVTPKYSFGIRYIPPSTGAWTANTIYLSGSSTTDAANIRPTVSNGLKYICTTAGTSHATTEPTWPTTLGTTVTDGTVTWTCAGTDGNSGHFYEFFVTGADPVANLSLLTSTVSASNTRTDTYTFSIRSTSTGIAFSVNGEPEQEIATTTAYVNGYISFLHRNDLGRTNLDEGLIITYFGVVMPFGPYT